MTEQHAAPAATSTTASSRWNVGRDAVGAVLLILALFMPWNVRFGFGVEGSNTTAYLVLVLATVLSLGAIAFVRSASESGGKFRLGLNIVYLLFVTFIAVGDTVFSVIFGATDTIPPGVGPGVWVGVAGALLTAQPTLIDPATDDQSLQRWSSASRILGWLAVAFGVQSFLFNMYWRIKSLSSGLAVDASGAQQTGFVIAAAVYGLMCLAAVLIGAWWMVKNTEASRLALAGLGVATVVTALVVWASDGGLGIVPFRGAVNNTTAGIGFQGYLFWTATAAIVGPLTLRNALSRKPADAAVWREALRACLLLIGVWGAGQIAVRLAYLGLASTGDVSLSPSVTATLIIVNLATAVLALWLRALLTSTSVTTVAVVLGAVLFIAVVGRVIAEIMVTASHTTATFHVVLTLLALIVAGCALRLRQVEVFAAATDEDVVPNATSAPRIVSASST